MSNILCFGELLKTQKVFLGKVFYSSDRNFKKFCSSKVSTSLEKHFERTDIFQFIIVNRETKLSS